MGERQCTLMLGDYLVGNGFAKLAMTLLANPCALSVEWRAHGALPLH